MTRKLYRYILDSGFGQFVAKFREYMTPERVQAGSTLLIALVTTWTLFFTPVGERIIAEMTRSVEETQEELERHRTVNSKITLRAVWSKFDDRLAENEYFANVAADYHAHVEWMNSADEETTSPSNEWFQIPYRDRFGEMIWVPFDEPGRWGERLRTMRNWWPADWLERPEWFDPVNARKELQAYLDGLLEEHFGGGGYGAPTTVSDVIEEMKQNEDVEGPGEVAAGMVRGMLDRFLIQHPTLASKQVRIRLTAPYSADEVIEAGEEIGRNVAEFRDALREYVRNESSPYF